MQKKFYAREKFHHVREMVEEKEGGEGREKEVWKGRKELGEKKKGRIRSKEFHQRGH